MENLFIYKLIIYYKLFNTFITYYIHKNIINESITLITI